MNKYIIASVTDYFKDKIKKKNFYFINKKKKIKFKEN